MRGFGFLTRALTVLCGLFIVSVGAWNVATFGIEAPSVIACLLGMALVWAPFAERGLRRAGTSRR